MIWGDHVCDAYLSLRCVQIRATGLALVKDVPNRRSTDNKQLWDEFIRNNQGQDKRYNQPSRRP